MKQPEDALWRALAAMRITPADAALGFTTRLAHEQAWTAAYAEAVVEEYRRFLYLAAISEEPVTPSDHVDQAWHLHLTYSRHYWDILCGTILKRPLHHDPSTGGADQDARHHAQYRATLARYRATFRVVPAPGIWPTAPAESAQPTAPVDRERYWLLSRSVTGHAGGIAAATLLITACAGLAGNGASEGASAMAIPVIAIAIGFVLLGLAMVSGRNSSKRKNGRDGGSSCGSSCSSDSSSDGGSSCGGGGCGGGGD